MAIARRLRLLVLMLAAPATMGARAPVDYVVHGDGVVAIRIAGQPARLRINPWAPPAPTINPDFAARAGLRGGWFGFSVKVGPVRVKGDSAVTRLEFGSTGFKRRAVWFERPYTRGADASIGPGGVPADVVRFQLRAAGPGERTISLPLVQKFFFPAYAGVKLGNRTLAVLFDPTHDRSLATAGAGQALAAVLGGQLVGETGHAEVAFGIERPIRTLRLGRPLAIGPLSFDSVAVRISDNGSTAGIADADADPDEITVTAKHANRRRDVLIVGADQLRRCSSIVFDKPAKQIRLTCA
ncbi:MAG: hypothetical protein WC816_14400 [Sphingomonas sp.]|jgi:hypothetical protein